MSDITITAEPPKPITVDLIGEKYTVRPIKSALGISLAQKFQGDQKDMSKFQKEFDQLLQIVFGTEDKKRVQKRLQDGEDSLDIQHVFELLNALMERASGNPTT